MQVCERCDLREADVSAAALQICRMLSCTFIGIMVK